MKDPRRAFLAQQLVNYCVRAKAGDRVLIEGIGAPREFVAELVNAVYDAGAEPHVLLQEPMIDRALLTRATVGQVDLMANVDSLRMNAMDCYIAVRSGDNVYEMGDVPAEKLSLYRKHYGKPVHQDIRVNQKRWVVLRYPAPAMAQQACMSTEAFEDHYFNVCNLDYAKMAIAMDAMVKRMAGTDKVRIVGPGTDLSFSIKGMPGIPCAGGVNIPDGEIFTAPVRDSVNGVLSYNTPALYQGTTFTDIRFVFENGKIVQATSNQTEKMNHILDTDDGARYIGEFALGVNPYINFPMMDTLFDEKIAGSFHFTPGNAYDECTNGNRSALHWDLVNIQTPAYGGGEIYFDGELIRKDGMFVTEDLLCLNPEALK